MFDAGPGDNMVSARELAAHFTLVESYMSCVGTVKGLSSHMMDGWFRDALVAPPMIEVVQDTLAQEYKFNAYVSLLDLSLAFEVEYPREHWQWCWMEILNSGHQWEETLQVYSEP